MKKLLVYSFASVFAAMSFNSCREKEVVTPAVVEQSETANGTRTYDFSLVVIATGTPGSRVEGISGATVTAVQDGNIVTVTTNETGVAYFRGLGEGNVAWIATAPSTTGTNFAKISGTTLLSVSSNYFNEPNQSNQRGVVSQIVKLPSLNAGLKGAIVGDFDFDNSTPVSAAPAGTTVRLQYAPASTNTSIGTAGSSYHPEPNYYLANVQADGSFTFANVPALDNNTDISATLLIEFFGTNNGQTYRFTNGNGSTPTGVGALLLTQRVYNMGTIQVNAQATNTSTVTGLIFGDFSFSNKRNFDGNYDPNIQFVSGVVINNSTAFGINLTDGFINGTQTILGVVYNDVDGKSQTVVGTNLGNIYDDDVVTVAGYSAADFKRKNQILNGVTNYIVLNAGGGNPFAEVVVASAVPYTATNFYSGSVLVELTYSPSGSYTGQTKFVTKTDPATGKFSIAGIPSGTYEISATYTGKFLTKDGYERVITLNSLNQRPNTGNVGVSGDIFVAPNTVTDFGASELVEGSTVSVQF